MTTEARNGYGLPHEERCAVSPKTPRETPSFVGAGNWRKMRARRAVDRPGLPTGIFLARGDGEPPKQFGQSRSVMGATLSTQSSFRPAYG